MRMWDYTQLYEHTSTELRYTAKDTSPGKNNTQVMLDEESHQVRVVGNEIKTFINTY